jgi:hypothetical protein
MTPTQVVTVLANRNCYGCNSKPATHSWRWFDDPTDYFCPECTIRLRRNMRKSEGGWEPVES